MNKNRITMLLDVEQRVAELEMRLPHGTGAIGDLRGTLSRIGLESSRVITYTAGRFDIVRTSIRESDDSSLGAARLAQVLRALRPPEAGLLVQRRAA